jgi:hypothetical protein
MHIPPDLARKCLSFDIRNENLFSEENMKAGDQIRKILEQVVEEDVVKKLNAMSERLWWVRTSLNNAIRMEDAL